MEDEILAKFRHVSTIFKENFQSPAIQQHNREYIDYLHNQLYQWALRTNEQIKEVIQKKTEEIQQLYEQYYQEVDENRARLNEQITNYTSLTDANEHIEDFNTYCRSNSIEKRIHLNLISFTENEISQKIQIEYIPYRDVPPETTIIPSKSIIKEKQPTSERVAVDNVQYEGLSPDSAFISIRISSGRIETAERTPTKHISHHESYTMI